MVEDGATLISEGNRGKQQTSNEEGNDISLGEKHSSLSSSLESDSDSEDSNSDELEDDDYSSSDEELNSAKRNLRLLIEAMNSPTNKKLAEERKRRYVPIEEKFNFPKDPENWREEDLRELWADPPWGFAKPGWDPMWANEKDWEAIRKQVEEKKDPSIAPFYLPYRRPFPIIPNNHFDIYSPKSVIEELDRIEEFLKWVSFVFNDGSTYEGTVWDDAAHGKGVYVAEKGLVRYEGEWLHNEMEGHGVVEVDIPDVQPVPGSKLETKMRKKGRIITRDFMSPEDRSWLEMDIEDTLHLVGGNREIPFYENDEWVKSYGQKPEKGRYRYAGQWKHGRIHGCGVFEVNERVIYGRFYFGHHLEDSSGCDSDVSALHAGIAEVAAAKARMFINKPDGMVREERGPYGDPQHPYFYEDDDAWMAPGFINQFYDVPDDWKTYVEEVDQERQMWLNSFYKAPLRIPMPAELEHWWSKDPDNPEFVLINQEPEPDPEDPSKLIYTEDPLILHTPTGRLINYVEDEKYGLRLFWQPHLKEGEDVDPDKAVFLPLGFDEFYGRVPASEKKPARFAELLMSATDVVRVVLERLDRWVEEKKKASETRQKHIEKELEYIEAEICLEEAVEDLEMELKMLEEEEAEDTSEIMLEEEAKDTSKISESTDRAEVPEAGEDESEDSEDEDDEGAPRSFGSVVDQSTDEQNKPGSSPFSSLSVSLASLGWASMLPCKLQNSFSLWRQLIPTQASSLNRHSSSCRTVGFQSKPPLQPKLRAMHQQPKGYYRTRTGHNAQLSSLARLLSSRHICENSKTNSETGRLVGLEKHTNLLSLCVPLSDTALMD